MKTEKEIEDKNCYICERNIDYPYAKYCVGCKKGYSNWIAKEWVLDKIDYKLLG